MAQGVVVSGLWSTILFFYLFLKGTIMKSKFILFSRWLLNSPGLGDRMLGLGFGLRVQGYGVRFRGFWGFGGLGVYEFRGFGWRAVGRDEVRSFTR